jgi:hypothetical protein
VSATVFYLVAIVLVTASPLVAPVTVTIAHAISNWRQNATAAHPAIAGAVRPVLQARLRSGSRRCGARGSLTAALRAEQA